MKKGIAVLLERLKKEGFIVKPCLGNHKLDGFMARISTPAGEDWIINFENEIDFMEYANDFNINDEVEFWTRARIEGASGVPGISALLKDAKWKKRTLNRIAKGL